MTTLGCLSSPKLSKLCDTAARPVRNRAVGRRGGSAATLIARHHGYTTTTVATQN